jgi:hypothetical protein
LLVLNLVSGTYNQNTGSTSVGACLVCPPGQYCPAASANPTPCDGESFELRSGRREVSMRAHAGGYNPTTGGASASACNVCPKGFYCLSGASNATACPPSMLMSTVRCAHACAVGRHLQQSHGRFSLDKLHCLVSCAAVEICSDGELLCSPAGAISSAASSAASNCTVCAAGYWCNITLGTSTACPAGESPIFVACLSEPGCRCRILQSNSWTDLSHRLSAVPCRQLLPCRLREPDAMSLW